MKKSYYLFIALLFSSTSLFAQVDYASEIQTIFNTRCTSCHGASGGISLTSYNSVINANGNAYGTTIIVPGDADASGLVDKIEPNPTSGSRMPQGGMLAQEDIDKIRLWINEGANAVPTSNENEVVNPSEFKLIGNFPNPFNPSTQIRFDVPVATQYTISVFSVHGQLVSEITGNVSAGRVQIPINLASSPTGIYYYRVTGITNGSRFEIGSGKMSLIK